MLHAVALMSLIVCPLTAQAGSIASSSLWNGGQAQAASDIHPAHYRGYRGYYGGYYRPYYRGYYSRPYYRGYYGYPYYGRNYYYGRRYYGWGY
jgi:hypothetical protein